MLGRENIREKVPRCVRQQTPGFGYPCVHLAKGAGGSECWLVTVTLSVRLRSVDVVGVNWGAQGCFSCTEGRCDQISVWEDHPRTVWRVV